MTMLPRMKISPIVAPSRGTGSSVVGIRDHQPLEHRIGDALPRLALGALLVAAARPIPRARRRP